MTRDKIIAVIEKRRDRDFCADGADEAIKWLESFPVEATEVDMIAALDNPEWAYFWATFIGTHRDQMAEIVIKATAAEWAYFWATFIGTHRDQMAEIVIKAAAAEWAYFWVKYVGTHRDQMAEIVIKAGAAKYASLWATFIGTHKRQMQGVIDNSNKERGEKNDKG